MNSFFKNTFITFVTRIGMQIISFITSIMVARFLGPEGKGELALILLLPTILTTFVNLGFSVSTTYFVGKKKFSLSTIVANNIFITFILSVVSIIIGAVLVFFMQDSYFKNIKICYLLLGLLIVPPTLFIQNIGCILQGVQEFKKYNLINLAYNIVYLLLLLFLFLFPSTYVALFALLGTLLINCLLFYLSVISPLENIRFNLDRLYIASSVKYGLKSYLNNVITYFNYRIDLLILNYFLNPTSVGYYTVAVSFAELLWIISHSASTVILPRVASLEKNDQKNQVTALASRVVLFFTFISIIIMFFLSNWVVKFFYSSLYAESIMPLKIILIGILSISFARILTNDLAGRGKPEYNTYASGVGLLLNIVLNIIFIPAYGINGAALSSSVSYSIQGIFTLLMYCKLTNSSVKEVILIRKDDFILIKNSIINFSANQINSKN